MDFESEKWKAKTLAGKGELRDERGSRDEEGKKKKRKEKRREEKRRENIKGGVSNRIFLEF